MGGGDRSSCPETFRRGSLVVNQVTVTYSSKSQCDLILVRNYLKMTPELLQLSVNFGNTFDLQECFVVGSCDLPLLR